VSVLKPKTTLYISEDEGETFKTVPVNFSPHVISCNPVSDKLIVAHDQDAKKVCGGYFKNFLSFNSFQLLSKLDIDLRISLIFKIFEKPITVQPLLKDHPRENV